MRTREDKIEKNDIEKLTEEINNLRLELETSNESINALSETVKTLSGNSTCEHKTINSSNSSKGRKIEANATFREAAVNHVQGNMLSLLFKLKYYIRRY